LDKPIVHSKFDLIFKLRKFFVKNILLQAMKYIPIYGKIVIELCVKNPRIKKVDPSTVQFVGRLQQI